MRQRGRMMSLFVDDEHHRDACQEVVGKVVHFDCTGIPQQPHMSSNKVAASLFQPQAKDGTNICQSDKMRLHCNEAVKEKQISGSQGATSIMGQQHPNGAHFKWSSMSGEYPDMSSNRKCSNWNIKTKGILTNSSVQYDRQEKILSVPNDSNSVWDTGPQHAMKQLRVEAQHVPWQQNEKCSRLNVEWKGILTNSSAKLQGSKTCSQHVNEPELCQNGVVNKKCSISTVTGRVEATLLSAQLQPRSSACLSRSSVSRECPAVAFVKKHLKLNVKTKGKLMNSSVEQQQQARYEHLPVRQLKAPD
jgi:hypothetical protein